MPKIFSGSSNKPLAEKICKALATSLLPVEITVFPDGEKRIRVKDSVIDKDTVVVQSAATPADQNYMELFFIIDALKRSGAKSVTAVIPYLGYQRQDHVFREGEAVSLDVVIKIIESLGVSKVVTFDLHSIKIPELFNIPLMHLSALPLFATIIARGPVAPSSRPTSSVASSLRSLDGTPSGRATPRLVDTVLVSPDMGGIRRIKILSELLGNMPYAAIVKNRDLETGEVTATKIEGEVQKSAVIVDDMISSGKTMIAAAQLLAEKGAEEIIAMATHAVFSGDVGEALQNSVISRVVFTDTIEIPKGKQFPKLEVLSVADIIAKELSNF